MKSYRLKAIAAVFATAILLSACGQPTGENGTVSQGTVAVVDPAGQEPLLGTEQELSREALEIPDSGGIYVAPGMMTLPPCTLAGMNVQFVSTIPAGASVQVQLARDPEFQDIIVDETGEAIRPLEVGYGDSYRRHRYVYPDHAEPWSETRQFSVQYPCLE